jgi:membrane protein required for colicin V production
MNWVTNWVDWTLIAIFVLSIVSGLAKGLVRESIGLAAAVLGIVAGARLYEGAAAFLSPWIPSPPMANVMGFLLIVISFLIVGGIAGRIVSGVLRTAGIGWVDRLAGGAFGAIRAAVLAIGLILIGMAFPRNEIPDAIIGSRLAPYFVEASYVLSSITPPELKESFSRNYEEVKRAWEEMWDHQPPRRSDSVI